MSSFDFNNLHDIKAFTTFYINEHDRLTEDDKDILYTFVDNANIDQLKNLLVTGKMTTHPLTEFRVAPLHVGIPAQTKGVFQAMSGKDYSIGMIDGVTTGITAVALVALASAVAYKIYKRFLSKAAKACNNKGGMEKTNCMAKFKKQATQAKIGVLQKGLSKCSKSKDPALCKNKLKVKISKEKAKMGEL